MRCGNALRGYSLNKLPRFNDTFLLLTKACNACHQTTHHQFNVIRVPDTPPFNNQEFKVK
ncbi:hypothetical protein MuYL_1289 [Mucilaginibacter xinganensis]|uniref:Uncharacterized protein n=1 Tax=Mucilaginibacter xinganensis TaxID=1234841 RepID=A0A223NTK2_9SPHI|nr:hypothetical protein MuYL_1289 [Mucilaginibacter xinganensis]